MRSRRRERIGLELIVPGVLGGAPGVGGSPLPACRAFETLLHRAAESASTEDLTEHVCGRFGVQRQAGDLPLGALTRAADGALQPGETCALLAAVHLHVDRDRAYVVPLAEDEIAEAESDALQELFSEPLARWQCDLQRERVGLWTVRARHTIALRTVALAAAAGKDAQACLPTGAQAREWLTLANEMQMLLHSHPVNERREQSGELTINSAWLWGVGELPAKLASPFAKVYGTSRILRGLAALGGTLSDAPPEKFTERVVSGIGERPVCVALSDEFGNPRPAQWERGLELLERNWFAPILGALRKGTLAQVTLWPGNGCVYRVTGDAVARWRFRKPRPLQHYIHNGPA